MTRMAHVGGSKRRKRHLWSTALLAVAPAALFIAAPAPAHAGGECTALGPGAYKECRITMNLRCESRQVSYLGVHATCTYPDGGRDECDETIALFGGGTDYLACTYIPPGSAPAPAPEPGAEPS